MPPKSRLPVVIEHVQTNSRGQTVTSKILPKRPSSAASLDKQVKRLRVFSPPGKIRHPAINIKVTDTPGPVDQPSQDDWEDTESDTDEQPTDVPVETESPKKAAPKTKGSNQYLQEWYLNYRAIYLASLYMQEVPPSKDDLCALCNNQPAQYQCTDCSFNRLTCKACLLNSHTSLPFHLIRCWKDGYFQHVNLRSLGHILYVGHNGSKCSQIKAETKPTTLLVLHYNGYHSLDVQYCQHHHAAPKALQLLQARLYPSTHTSPQTAFSFCVLDHFAMFATHAKLSAHRFNAVLTHSTNPLLPHKVPNRYRELMKVSRQWTHLIDLKRGGVQPTAEKNLQYKLLGPECIACPAEGITFEYLKVPIPERWLFQGVCEYDGNFHQFRKDNPYDQDDICLSDGQKYFVGLDLYRQFLQDNTEKPMITSKTNPDCNNMKAVTTQFIKFAGLDTTGIGSCICRHGCFHHSGTVNYYAGERYLFTDYAIASVIHLQQQKGIKIHAITYDIFCQWFPKFQERLAAYDANDALCKLPVEIVGGIGKFHAPAHRDECYILHSLNNKAGFGRLDGEGVERVWAFLNDVAGSASEKGPGARMDQLNQLQGHWNWQKIIGLATYTAQQYWKSKEMYQDTKESWDALSSSISQSTLQKWESYTTSPKKVGNKWTSVFMPDSEPTEVNPDSSTVSTGTPQSETEQVVASIIALELDQHEIDTLIKQHGSKASSAQQTKVHDLQLALQKKSDLLQERYISVLGVSTTEPASHKIWIEDGILAPPSSLQPTSSMPHAKLQELQMVELKLRSRDCFIALQDLLNACILKALLLRGKDNHAHAQKITTRANTRVVQHTKKIDQCKWYYRRCQTVYQQLQVHAGAKETFPKLLDGDISALLRILIADRRELGEGSKVLPWFCHPPYNTSGFAALSDLTAHAGVRVEWFRGRERWKRWQEELKILKVDMVSILKALAHKRGNWLTKAEKEPGCTSATMMGYSAYSRKQASYMAALQAHGVQLFKPCLLDGTVQVKWCEDWLSKHRNLDGLGLMS